MRITADDISPFSGNASIVKEYHEPSDDNMALCLDTGYHTYEKSWKVDDQEVLDAVEASLPDICIEQKRVIGDQVWYKIILMTGFLIVTPEMKDGKTVWCVYNFREGDPDKEPTYKFETVDGNKIDRAFDETTRREFAHDNFSGAWEYFQIANAQIVNKMKEVVGMLTEEEE